METSLVKYESMELISPLPEQYNLIVMILNDKGENIQQMLMPMNLMISKPSVALSS